MIKWSWVSIWDYYADECQIFNSIYLRFAILVWFITVQQSSSSNYFTHYLQGVFLNLTKDPSIKPSGWQHPVQFELFHPWVKLSVSSNFPWVIHWLVGTHPTLSAIFSIMLTESFELFSSFLSVVGLSVLFTKFKEILSLRHVDSIAFGQLTPLLWMRVIKDLISKIVNDPFCILPLRPFPEASFTSTSHVAQTFNF